MSDFHPETWSPTWSVGNILTGLLSFMNSDEMTTGGMIATSCERKTLASASRSFNAEDRVFRELFGDADQLDVKFGEIDRNLSVQSAAAAAAAAAAAVVGVKFGSTRDSTKQGSPSMLKRPSEISLKEIKEALELLGVSEKARGLYEKADLIQLLNDSNISAQASSIEDVVSAAGESVASSSTLPTGKKSSRKKKKKKCKNKKLSVLDGTEGNYADSAILIGPQQQNSDRDIASSGEDESD